MKNIAITQRLKGLISNLEDNLESSKSIISLNDRNFGTIRYDFLIQSFEHFHHILQIVFKTESVNDNELMPIEDQTATVFYKKENAISLSYEKEFSTTEMDLEIARNFIKKLNRDLKEHKDDESKLSEIIIKHIKEFNNSGNTDFDTHNAEQALAGDIQNLEDSKSNYYNVTEEINQAREAAQKEFLESPENKEYKELKAKLEASRVRLSFANNNINKKYKLDELDKKHSLAKDSWHETKEDFAQKTLKVCREFKLPLAFVKKFKAIKEIDSRKVELFCNRLTRFF